MYGKTQPSQADLKATIRQTMREVEQERKRDAWWSIQIAGDYL